MTRKNPDNKPLKIQKLSPSDNLLDLDEGSTFTYLVEYGKMLSNLAIAESNLVTAGKDSAMPHFLAIVKELERIYEFKFVIDEDLKE